jgi:hypothetical protein
VANGILVAPGGIVPGGAYPDQTRARNARED